MRSPREGVDREEKSCPERWSGMGKGGPRGCQEEGETRRAGALRPAEEGGDEGPEMLWLGRREGQTAHGRGSRETGLFLLFFFLIAVLGLQKIIKYQVPKLPLSPPHSVTIASI